MTESNEFLVASMAYCLSWEVGGMRASRNWQSIREYVQSHPALSETERWVCELYEESSPTAQEERSILSRINARPHHQTFRKEILGLLPESIKEAAAKHRLMHMITLPGGAGRIRAWLADHKIASLSPEPVDLPPLAAREADFRRFIEHPYFLEGFRKFWHKAPKHRNNQQMRVLLAVSAALSQMVTCDEESDLAEWSRRLGRMGSYTEQSQKDVAELSTAMLDESYDAQELAYRLFVDAEEVDQINLQTFCGRYADELTGFARDFVRGMLIAP